MMVTIAADAAAKGKKAGIFTPEHKQFVEPFDEISWALREVKLRGSRQEGVFRTRGGGIVDCWAVTDNELAGRGREYDVVLIDEAAFTKNGQMRGIWEKSIRPTMITRSGARAWAFSTPFGISEDNFFYQICTDPAMEFKEHHAPSSTNPYIPPEELEREKKTNHPLVFQQEFLAEFVDWSGVAFFQIDKMLVEKAPVPYPAMCDTVFAVIDTAVKDQKEHDGTAVSFFALSQHVGTRLVLLDWDIVSIEGASLEHWLPSVITRLQELAPQCRARLGALGVFIEDKASGTILLQQGRNRGWPVHAIDSKLTSLGKSERALNVSGYFWQENFKISDYAYNKTVSYKGVARNHWLSQVTGFRIGSKDGQADDLLDTFTYGLAIGLGNPEGF